MYQKNISYAKAESCFYEAMRINKGGSSEWSPLKEGNALIDKSLTHLNYELFPHHPALNPDDYDKCHRGRGIAEYHKSVTGSSARMNGDEKQRSKAVGIIITLPKDYIENRIELTDEEYASLENYVESSSHIRPERDSFKKAMMKLQNHSFTETEYKAINLFFQSALKAWQQYAGIRDEDMLYAIVHLDESWPHLHIMALPTYEKEEIDKKTGEIKRTITFSTAKFSNYKTHYFDHLHPSIIELMAKDGINATGLLNGKTKDMAFNPADMNRQERQKGVQIIKANHALEHKLDIREKELSAKEIKIKQVEKELRHKEKQLSIVKDNLSVIVRKRIKKKLTAIVEEKIREIFDTINNFILRYFKGKTQKKLFDQIGHLPLPPEFVVDGTNYGGMTIAEAMAEAGERDMKELLSNSDHSDITTDDDYGITKSLIHDSSVDDIVEQIQSEIDDIDLD